MRLLRNFSPLLSVAGAHHAEVNGNKHNYFIPRWLGVSAGTAAACGLVGATYTVPLVTPPW